MSAVALPPDFFDLPVDSELDGQEGEDRLEAIGITANRNTVPFDPRPPMVASGVRLGTSALATRGLDLDDFTELGEVIRTAFGPRFEARRPLYPGLRATTLGTA